MTATAAILWRSTLIRLAIAVLPIWFTAAVLIFHTPWSIKLLVGSVFAASCISPEIALVAVALVLPLGDLIGYALDLHTFRVTEAVVVAFFAGWLVRQRRDGDGPRVPATFGWLAALMVGASIVAQAWRIADQPGMLQEQLRILYQAYYIIPDRIGFGPGARLLEGIGLLAAATSLFRAQPRLAVTMPAATCVAGFAAACSSLLLIQGIAFAPVLARYARTAPRVAAHVGDVNAAASYFAMVLLMALGMAARRLSRATVLWIGCAAVQAAALWLTGSRTGVAAAAIVGGAAAVYAVTAMWSHRSRAVAMAAVVLVALAAGALRAWTLRHDVGTEFRRDFYASSIRMIAARPLTGVGIGQYYDASPLYLSRFLGWVYGAENAHNSFLQLVAELGAIGAASVLALLALAVSRGARAVLECPADTRLLGCGAAVTAWLATCLTGNALLVDEVAFPFWILLGLLVALAGSALPTKKRLADNPSVDRVRSPVLMAAGAAGVVVLFVSTARKPLLPSDAPAVTGLEPWETAPDGTRYRWTHEYASVFVPRTSTRVQIPVRLPVDLPGITPVGVSVRTTGIDRARTLVGTSWTKLDVELPPIDSMQSYRRVDLKVDRTWQPAIYVPGSGDLRRVGVQTGPIQVFSED